MLISTDIFCTFHIVALMRTVDCYSDSDDTSCQTAGVCVDVADHPVPVHQTNEEPPAELQDHQEQATEEQEEMYEEEEEEDDTAAEWDTEPAEQEMTEAPVSELTESEEKENVEGSTEDEVVQQLEPETEVMGRIEVPAVSEEDDCDFNTCDEGLDSLQGSARMSDQGACLGDWTELKVPSLPLPSTDRSGAVGDPDDGDEPPMAPRPKPRALLTEKKPRLENKAAAGGAVAVSYTHLTLPTILRV